MTRPASPCPFYGMPCQYVPMANRTDELEAENAKLRAALEEIRDRHVPDQPSCLDIDEADYIRRQHTELRRIARAALGFDT